MKDIIRLRRGRISINKSPITLNKGGQCEVDWHILEGRETYPQRILNLFNQIGGYNGNSFK